MGSVTPGGPSGSASFLALCYATEDEAPLLAALRREGAKEAGDLSSLEAQAAHQRTPDGRSALHRCVAKQWMGLAAVLVRLGASPLGPGLGRSQNTPLHIAAFKGDPGMLKVLLASKELSDPQVGCGADCVNGNGDTPLLFACANGHLGAAALLLGAGASPVAINKDGLTPLLAALGSGGGQLLRLLLRRLGDLGQLALALEHRDCNGRTALLVAVESDNAEATKALLVAGADPVVKDSRGRSVLSIARQVNPSKGDSKASKGRGQSRPEVLPGNPQSVLSCLQEAIGGREAEAQRVADQLLQLEERTKQTPMKKLPPKGPVRSPFPAAREATTATEDRSEPETLDSSETSPLAEATGPSRTSLRDKSTIAGGTPEEEQPAEERGMWQVVTPGRRGRAGSGGTTASAPTAVDAHGQRERTQAPKATTLEKGRTGSTHTPKRLPDAPKPRCDEAQNDHGATVSEGSASGTAQFGSEVRTHHTEWRGARHPRPEPSRRQKAGILRDSPQWVVSGTARGASNALSDEATGVSLGQGGSDSTLRASTDVNSSTTDLGSCPGWAAKAMALVEAQYPKMSMSQLEALEAVHHDMLAQLAAARVQLAARQMADQQLEASKLAREIKGLE